MLRKATVLESMPTELLQGGAIFKGLRDTWILDYWIVYESFISQFLMKDFIYILMKNYS